MSIPKNLLLAVAAALAVCGHALAELGPSPGDLGADHAQLACSDCHAEGSETVSCRACHEEAGHIHPIGVTPTFTIPAEFPTVQGKVDCISCHGVHAPNAYKHLREVGSEDEHNLEGFCSCCHGGGVAMKNPHQATAGADRCRMCHISIDVAAVLAGQRPKLRAPTGQLCNFCHDVRGKGHPKNIDPALGLPPGLPRSGDGTIGCQTCHEPHGSVHYTHYVREPYAEHFERAKSENPHINDYFACPNCHTEEASHRITAANHGLRFEHDMIMLCISCHPRSRSHHPVGVTMDQSMVKRMEGQGGLPVDRGGRITCITCHSNNCENDDQKMVMRFYNSNPPDFTLCWYCHDKETLQKVNPHEDSLTTDATRCLTCHDRVPLKGVQTTGNLYFVSKVRMLCLRCHEDVSEMDLMHSRSTPPPDMLERMREMEVEKNIRLPIDVDGTVTCSTCHNAHFSKNPTTKTRLPYNYMCAKCHDR